MKRHDERHIATSTIKSVLSGCFPPNRNITKQEIFQARVRCRRLMPQFENCDDFKKFEENLKSDSAHLKQIESDLSLEDDEANQMTHELFDCMFNSVNNNQSSSYSDDDNNDEDKIVWKFQDYLKLLSKNIQGF